MFEELNKRRQAVAYNIAKSFENDIEKAIGAGYDLEGGDGDDVEKAHQVGDVHSNGKWVWTEYAPGKFDWRGIKKNAPEKKQKVEGSGSKEVDDFMDKVKIFNNKYTDINKVSVVKTPKGNWDVSYDGNRLGIINADQLSEKTAKKMGWLREDEKVKSTDDIVLTNEDYDRVFHNVGLSRQTPFYHNNKPYILKIFGKHMDGSYLISVHNGDTGKRLQGDSNIAISVRRAFINQLKQEKLRDIERNAKKKPSSKKNPSELETISEVEDYAKSISGVTFKSVKSGWDDKGAKAFELTYPHGGKLVIDFLNNEEYVYELTDSNDKSIISTNSTNETAHTDWSIRLNPDKLVSRRVEVLKTKLTKLKGEETKARNKMTRNYSSFSDKYAYQKASEAVSDMKTKIQELQSLIGTF